MLKVTRVSIGLIAAGLGILSGCSTQKQLPPVLDTKLSQLRFSDPAQAVSELKKAVDPENEARLTEIFGPEAKNLLHSGDPAEDAKRFKLFVTAFEAQSELVPMTLPADGKQEPTQLVLLIGQQKFPFPIPLVKDQSSWRFNTEVGKQELLSRRIGSNELTIIDFCEGFVEAQLDFKLRQFIAWQSQVKAGTAKGSMPTPYFASKFFSSAGQHDGLYWETAKGVAPSPLGPMVAAASAEGLALGQSQPFHGYYFRILTQQSANARGGAMNYVKNGKMTAGFAMIAYPAKWGESGIMTFIVGPDGVIYQKNFGPTGEDLVKKINSFDPDLSWDPVL